MEGGPRFVMEGHERSWKVFSYQQIDISSKKSYGWVELCSRLCWCVQSAMLVACRIIVTAPVHFRIWIGTIGTLTGLDWIWDLIIGLGLVKHHFHQIKTKR